MQLHRLHFKDYLLSIFQMHYIYTDLLFSDCFNPVAYNKFNYTGCEVTQSCWDGKCFNSTVCICEVSTYDRIHPRHADCRVVVLVTLMHLPLALQVLHLLLAPLQQVF